MALFQSLLPEYVVLYRPSLALLFKALEERKSITLIHFCVGYIAHVSPRHPTHTQP